VWYARLKARTLLEGGSFRKDWSRRIVTTMLKETQLYGQVITSEVVKLIVEKDWAEMDENDREWYTRSYPATLISAGIDPTPYLAGSNVDLGSVMEHVTKEMERRNKNRPTQL
jgi:hypothetical protein